METASPWVGCVPTRDAQYTLVLAILQLTVKDKAWPEILRSHKSNFPTLKLEMDRL